MKQKKFFITIAILVAMIAVPHQAQAVLQANPNTNGASTDIPINWMTKIRSMEKSNQAMGLDETIDGTTMKATSGSNSIDVHMIKTTEYGAVAILSASGYGNANTIQSSSIKTTTGNKSGVYFNQDWEWTAGGWEDYIFPGVDSKYYNAYTTSNTSSKIGDALGSSTTTNPGCMGWHGAQYKDMPASNSDPYMMRGSGSIFSYTNYTFKSWSQPVRAVVVCGTGF